MDSRKAGAVALSIVAVCCRVLAVALCALTVALCFNGVPSRLNIVAFVVDLTRALPDVIAGYGLIPTPFGGVFRFDFALMATSLFCIDYACARLSRVLR
ncbi:MAG: hypothetical protein Q4B77_01815 [Coriobacteriaceae bacterium]|nr:hypothetical protein [Coriobacteriaceae bacterium]